MDKCLLHRQMLRMGFTPVMKHSRVHWRATLDQDQSPVAWFAKEVFDCIQTNSNEPHQGVKRSGVQFNQTEQGW